MTKTILNELRFENLGVAKEILTSLQKSKFTTPTPIQQQCIPESLKGKDVVGIAQTGTGKTLAFAIPILQHLKNSREQALVLVPTRELAIQAKEMVQKIGESLGFKTAVIIGGEPSYNQIRELKRSPHIIIATPGRLIDHLTHNVFNLDKVKIVVLDEADHMLDIGFLPDITRILNLTPKEHQTLLFSATMPPTVVQVITRFMKMPVRIEVAPAGTVASGVKHELFILSKQLKLSLLEKTLSENEGKILIFLKTKSAVKKITKNIYAMGHTVTEIHSDRSLPQRKKAMAGFKEGKYRVLVATDIAARGIDVNNISVVINYDLPQCAGDYVHRIGRTGRAGKNGRAISFVTPDQRGNIKQIERLIKKSIPVLSLPALPKVSDEVIRAGNTTEREEKSNYRRSPKPFRRDNFSKKKNNSYGKTFYQRKNSSQQGGFNTSKNTFKKESFSKPEINSIKEGAVKNKFSKNYSSSRRFPSNKSKK
jgi:ATP-dependent RNA helicase RhlE